MTKKGLRRKRRLYNDPYKDKAFERKKKVFLFVINTLFFVGLVLSVFVINIYRETLISESVPICIYIISGVFFCFYTDPLLKKYDYRSNLFLTFVLNTMAFGGIICYLFMALNFYFPALKEDVYKVAIERTGALARGRSNCGMPYAEVRIKGYNKQLIYLCNVKVDGNSFVTLTIKRGFLGFDIITKNTLSKD